MRTLWPAIDKIQRITPHQRERVAISLSRPVGILGGNPGAGKTFTSCAIIESIIAEHGPDELRVCAPTGKAGVRLTEGMLEYGIEGVEATTTHRMLGVTRNGHDGEGWGFSFNAENPLPIKFCLLDESSMYDVSLQANAMAAMKLGTHVLFSGDFGQLPPVGHGAPLRDMIAAGIPYGELEKIHRNEGDVIRACRDLKAGRMFKPSPRIDLEAGHNFPHFELKPGESAVERIMKIIPAAKERFGFDPVWDTQVICALNEDSLVSRDVLNKHLQQLLNPLGVQPPGTKKMFRMGDKVINRRNNILKKTVCPNFAFCPNPVGEPEWHFDKKRYICPACFHQYGPATMLEDFVANGEIGRVVMMVPGFMHVAFDSPRRTLRFAGENQDELELAYAITCHNSQGSQWPFVIVMIDDSRSADFVTSWEWFRTAASRLEKLGCTVGKFAAMERQCKRSALKHRKTFLRERIQERLMRLAG